MQRDDLTPKETSQAMQKALKVMSVRDLAKKIGKTEAYVVDMAGTGKLLNTLNRHDIQVSKYASEEDLEEGNDQMLKINLSYQ